LRASEQATIHAGDRLCFDLWNRHSRACFKLIGRPLADAAGVDPATFFWPANLHFFSQDECAAAQAAVAGLSQRLQDEPDMIFVDLGTITVGRADPAPLCARVRRKRVRSILARLARLLAAAATGEARLAFGSGWGYRLLCGLPPVHHYS
jgi:hypothetical protein